MGSTGIASLPVGNGMLSVLNLPMVGPRGQQFALPSQCLYAGILDFAMTGDCGGRQSAFEPVLHPRSA